MMKMKRTTTTTVTTVRLLIIPLWEISLITTVLNIGTFEIFPMTRGTTHMVQRHSMNQTCRQEGERFQNTEICSMDDDFGINVEVTSNSSCFML
mmetsp:Transcript_19352/g.39931  ORF Transcript_19352/g.39931 Transcript_19352/m.39931 type:complete len:94 (-) Transcript_19352:19-300(-)